ncbi:ferrochelatase [Porphyromonas sp.]
MKAIVLCNIATPKSSASEDVREYLSKFLSDRYVISIPQPFRSILVNGIIIPRRLRHSTARYRVLESLYEGEMPLRKYMNALVETMQGLSQDWDVFGYLQHGEERPEDLVARLRARGDYTEIVVLPLFPHKTFSTYLSASRQLCRHLRRLLGEGVILRVTPPYFRHPHYIQLIQKRLADTLDTPSDLYVAGFHSIPIKHQRMGRKRGFNYREQCLETATQMFSILPHTTERRVYFQSALDRVHWIGPFLEEEMKGWVDEGFHRVTIACPGFAIDCLETVLDIGVVLREEFLSLGGQELRLLPALNGDEDVADFLLSLAHESLDIPSAF